MTRRFIRPVGLVLSAAVVLLAAGCSSGSSSSNPTTATSGARSLKVAVVAPSAVNDLAFTESMVQAVQALKAKYNLTISISDNQFVVADAANVIRQYASEGYNLIVAHGSQYGGTVQQLAPQFPKVSFAWGTAGVTFGDKNVFAYQAASNQGGYVQGYMAAKISKSHTLGVIGPIAVGDAKLYVDGFAAGAKAANPSTTVHVTYTGSFSDVSLASKAATTYVSDGADVMTGSAQMVVGAIGVCKAHDIAWFGTQWNQASLAPAQVVSSQVYHWQVVLNPILTDIQHGVLGGSTYVITLANGGEGIQLNPGYPLAQSVKAAEQQQVKAVESGSVTVPS